MASIKLSNIHEHKVEVLKRLRGKNIINKAKVIKAIKTDDWEYVYKEILYRLESYTMEKIVNYTRKDIQLLITASLNYGPEVIAKQLYTKNFPDFDDTALNANYQEAIESGTISNIDDLELGMTYAVDATLKLDGVTRSTGSRIFNAGDNVTIDEVDIDNNYIELSDDLGDQYYIDTNISGFRFKKLATTGNQGDLVPELEDFMSTFIVDKQYKVTADIEAADAENFDEFDGSPITLILNAGDTITINEINIEDEYIAVTDSEGNSAVIYNDGVSLSDIWEFGANIVGH